MVQANIIPNCKSFDPCYAYEMAVIIHDGMQRMFEKQESVYYYITAWCGRRYCAWHLPTEGIG